MVVVSGNEKGVSWDMGSWRAVFGSVDGGVHVSRASAGVTVFFHGRFLGSAGALKYIVNP